MNAGFVAGGSRSRALPGGDTEGGCDGLGVGCSWAAGAGSVSPRQSYCSASC